MTIRKCHRCKLDSDESSKSFWKRFDAGLKEPYICRDCIRCNQTREEWKKDIQRAKKLIKDNQKLINETSAAILQRKHKITYESAEIYKKEFKFQAPEDGEYRIQFKRKENQQEKFYSVVVELKEKEIIVFPEGTYFHSVKLQD